MIIPGTFLLTLAFGGKLVFFNSILRGYYGGFWDFFLDFDFLLGLPLAGPLSSPEVSSLVKFDFLKVVFNSTTGSLAASISRGFTWSTSSITSSSFRGLSTYRLINLEVFWFKSSTAVDSGANYPICWLELSWIIWFILPLASFFCLASLILSLLISSKVVSFLEMVLLSALRSRAEKGAEVDAKRLFLPF